MLSCRGVPVVFALAVLAVAPDVAVAVISGLVKFLVMGGDLGAMSSSVAVVVLVVSFVASPIFVVSCVDAGLVVISFISTLFAGSFADIAWVSLVAVPGNAFFFITTAAGEAVSFIATARVVVAVAVGVIGNLALIALRCGFMFFAGCTALCCLYNFRAMAW